MWDLMYDGTQHALTLSAVHGDRKQPDLDEHEQRAGEHLGAGGGPVHGHRDGRRARSTSTGRRSRAGRVSGDYTRTTNLQRLQLWNDGPLTTDFDQVVVAGRAGTAGVPGAPTGRHGHRR